MKEFLEEFEAFLKDDKFEEAKTLLSTFGSLETTPEERAEAKLFVTHLYIKLTNAVNRAYLSQLDDAISKLQTLDAKEKEVDEKLKLAETRAGLVS